MNEAKAAVIHLLVCNWSAGPRCATAALLFSHAMLLLTSLLTGTAVAAPFTVEYVHNDHLGRPVAVTDQDQNAIWRAHHEPFGEVHATTGFVSDPRVRFPGQYEDNGAGLYYNHHRYYDPSSGRYLTSDPIGLAGGLNTYAYAVNNPLRYVDPTGEAICGGFCIGMGLFALSVWNYYDTATDMVATAGTLTDECSTTQEKLLSIGILGIGLLDPTPGNQGKRALGFYNPAAELDIAKVTGFLGSKRLQLHNAPYQPVRNTPTRIGERDYSAHALDQMQNRGLMPSIVEHVIQTGLASPGKHAGSTQFVDRSNNLRVLVNSDTGRVITVIPGIK